MKLNVYAVRDELGKFYVQTMHEQERQEGDIIAGFKEALENPKTKVGKRPETFAMYLIATYDDTEGRFQNLDHAEIICRGSEITKEQQEILKNGQKEQVQNQ